MLQNFRISSVSFPARNFFAAITSMAGEESSSYGLFSEFLLQILSSVQIKSPVKRVLTKAISMPSSMLYQKQVTEELSLTSSLYSYFGDAPEEIQGYLPLLNILLPSLDIPHNSLTRNMFGELQALNLGKVITWMFEKLIKNKPLVLIIENIQWIDSASGRVLGLISQLPSLLLICSWYF